MCMTGPSPASLTRQAEVQLPLGQVELLELLSMVPPAGTDVAFRLMMATGGGRLLMMTPTSSGDVTSRPQTSVTLP